MAKPQITRIERSILTKRSLEEVFAFFDRPANVQRVTPEAVAIKTEHHPPDLRPGAIFAYRLERWPVDLEWDVVVSEYRPPQGFTNVQSNGYFYMWNHSYRFLPAEDATEIRVSLDYEMPPGLYARFSNSYVIRGAMEELVSEQVRAVGRALALEG